MIYSYPFFAIIAGASSNLIDRFSQQGVIDFINIKIIPVFNLADASIVIGAIALALVIVKPNFKRELSRRVS